MSKVYLWIHQNIYESILNPSSKAKYGIYFFYPLLSILQTNAIKALTCVKTFQTYLMSYQINPVGSLLILYLWMLSLKQEH